jgi:hypothetical protein
MNARNCFFTWLEKYPEVHFDGKGKGTKLHAEVDG